MIMISEYLLIIIMSSKGKSSRPIVTRTKHTTTVFYPTSNASNSNVNRPAQLIRKGSGTTCIYRK